MSSRLADLRRARLDAPSQGYTGERTKWSGAREHVSSPADYGHGDGGSSHQQALALGLDQPPATSAHSRSGDRYSSQRSFSGDSDAVATQPQRQNSWASWFGGKTAEPEEDEEAVESAKRSSTSTGHRASTNTTAQRASTLPSSTGARTSGTVSRPPVTPGKPRYIPPSERAPGGPAWEGAHVHEQDNSWSAWASKQTRSASEMMQSAGESINAKWDSVNDAHKRDQAVSAVGSGAVKVAGGAVKYTAKGVWAVGKAAFK